MLCIVFFFYAYGDHRDLHSFPTRRSSDLYHNCSGKHAGMLAVCRARGWPTEGYRLPEHPLQQEILREDRKSTRLNSSHPSISYAVFCLKKKIKAEYLVSVDSPYSANLLAH